MERAKEASGQTGASTTDRSRRIWKVVEVHPYPVDVFASVDAAQRKHTRQYADVTLVLALTGLRFGKLRGLRVRDVVDVPYPALVVKRSIPQSGRTGAVIERATTKSGRSRLVPLSEPVQRVIAKWSKDHEPDDLVFPAPGRLPACAGLAAGGPLERNGVGPPTARP